MRNIIIVVTYTPFTR